MFFGIGIQNGKTIIFDDEKLEVVRRQLFLLVEDHNGEKIGIWYKEENIFHLPTNSENRDKNVQLAKASLDLPVNHTFQEIVPTS